MKSWDGTNEIKGFLVIGAVQGESININNVENFSHRLAVSIEDNIKSYNIVILKDNGFIQKDKVFIYQSLDIRLLYNNIDRRSIAIGNINARLLLLGVGQENCFVGNCEIVFCLNISN